jgi:hypothetical protein
MMDGLKFEGPLHERLHHAVEHYLTVQAMPGSKANIDPWLVPASRMVLAALYQHADDSPWHRGEWPAADGFGPNPTRVKAGVLVPLDTP